MRHLASRLLLVCCISPLLYTAPALAQLGGDQSGNDPFARVQFIHNMPETGLIDVYVDGRLWLDDLDFRDATPYEPLANGAHSISFVAGADTTDAAPFWQGDITVVNQQFYVFAAQGRAGDPQLTVRDHVRAASSTSDAEFFFIHGAPDTGRIDIRLRDPAKGNVVVNLLQNNLAFGRSGIYLGLVPGQYNFEVTTADLSRVLDIYNFNLSGFGNRSVVFVASGLGTSASEGFLLIGYDDMGAPILPSITTASNEETTVPTAFALAQNYPNPFNPTTQIDYTLPQAAGVRLVVYDLLGRAVRTLVQAEQPAGPHTAGWDGLDDAGTPAPSGVYLYRLEAGTFTQTRRMLLMK